MSQTDGWKARGAGRWISTDSRFSIVRESSKRFHVVDLDTYDEVTKTTLDAAKSTANAMRGAPL